MAFPEDRPYIGVSINDLLENPELLKQFYVFLHQREADRYLDFIIAYNVLFLEDDEEIAHEKEVGIIEMYSDFFVEPVNLESSVKEIKAQLKSTYDRIYTLVTHEQLPAFLKTFS